MSSIHMHCLMSRSVCSSSVNGDYSSAGSLSNLISVDTRTLMNSIRSLHDFWSLPLQVGIALYLLWQQMGVAMFAGLAVIVVLIPTNAILTKAISNVSRSIMQWKDKRLGILQDMFSHMDTVKLMCLENGYTTTIIAFSWLFKIRMNLYDLDDDVVRSDSFRFKNAVEEEREKEVKCLARRKYLDAM